MKLKQRLAEAMLTEALTRLDLCGDDILPPLECIFDPLSKENREKIDSHLLYRNRVRNLSRMIGDPKNVSVAAILLKEWVEGNGIPSFPSCMENVSTISVDAILNNILLEGGFDICEKELQLIGYASEKMKQALFHNVINGRITTIEEEKCAQVMVGRPLESIEVDELLLAHEDSSFMPINFPPWLDKCSELYVRRMAYEAFGLFHSDFVSLVTHLNTN